MATSKHSGFTVIEMAIVLLLVGFMAGVILIGRDLIRSAELRGDIATVNKFDQAVNMFQLKYDSLPGDAPNASQFFPGAYDGDGDNLINTYYVPQWGPSTLRVQALDGTFIGTEVAYAIDDLARANLSSTQPFDANSGLGNGRFLSGDEMTPKFPSGGHFMVRSECVVEGGPGACSDTGRHTYRLGVSDGANGGGGFGTLSTDSPNYTGADAFYIDTKLDDGLASAGKVTAAGANIPGNSSMAFLPISLLYSNGVCDASGSFGIVPADVGLTQDCQYDMSVKDRKVGLFIRAAF